MLTRKDLKIALLAGFVSILAFLTLLSGFFQQDEWLGYSRSILLTGSGPAELFNYAFAPSSGHYIPFTLLAVYFLYRLFGLNYNIFVVISLILHFTNVVLVYFFTRKLFKDYKMAFLSALIFGVFAPAYQGTAWVVANISTHVASIFALLSMIYIQKKKIYLSIVLLITSLFFKEIAIGLFLILPLIILLEASYKKQQKKRYVLLLLGAAGVYGLFRLMGLIVGTSSGLPSGGEVSVTKTIYNFLTLPLKSFVQSFIPPGYLRSVSFFFASFFRDEITGGVGSPLFEKFAIKRVFEVLNLGIFALIGFFILKLYRMKKLTLTNSTVFLLGVLFIAINSLIYALAPEGSGITSIVDSRNLYFTAIGASIMAVALARLYRKLGYLLLIIFVLFNFFTLVQSLKVFNERGSVRSRILSVIKESYPDFPDRVVFYLESDTSYYGLPEEDKIPPFQSGFGQTLLAYYWEQEKYPKEFYEGRFLWEISSQGYKQIGPRGFGYYRDFEQLKKSVEENGIQSDWVISFSWSEKDEIFRDISDEVRERLTKL